MLLSSGAAAASAGQGGTTAAGGSGGGAAGTVAAATTAPLGQMALARTLIAGHAAGRVGATGAATSYTPSNTAPILPGLGGGGKTAGAGGE
ncbi:MAG: hypothetical protein VW405_08200, partial [Rhodospirillaceae bacterium]